MDEEVQQPQCFPEASDRFLQPQSSPAAKTHHVTAAVCNNLRNWFRYTTEPPDTLLLCRRRDAASSPRLLGLKELRAVPAGLLPSPGHSTQASCPFGDLWQRNTPHPSLWLLQVLQRARHNPGLHPGCLQLPRLPVPPPAVLAESRAPLNGAGGSARGCGAAASWALPAAPCAAGRLGGGWCGGRIQLQPASSPGNSAICCWLAAAAALEQELATSHLPAGARVGGCRDRCCWGVTSITSCCWEEKPCIWIHFCSWGHFGEGQMAPGGSVLFSAASLGRCLQVVWS